MDALKASWRAGELLPLWMGFVGCVAVFNSVQNYLTLSFTRRVYDRSPSQGMPSLRRGICWWRATLIHV